MGLSLRAAAFVRERARQRAAARMEAEAAANAAAAEMHRTWLDRTRAADRMGVSLDQLRRMVTAGTSPAYVKGPHKQSPPYFHVAEVDAWRADPAAYRLTRATRMAELAATPAAPHDQA